jgi:hypothetical protein
MAGHARYTALFDACVLYPITVADALLSLAVAGFYAAKWTTEIETEWIRAIERQRPDLVGRLETRRQSMRDAIPDWEITETAWRSVQLDLQIPDPQDAHVLAAAIVGHVDCIVTSNVKDFPSAILDPLNLTATDPDTFILQQWDLDPIRAAAAFQRMRARRKKPEAKPADFADALEKAGLPVTAERLRSAADLI